MAYIKKNPNQTRYVLFIVTLFFEILDMISFHPTLFSMCHYTRKGFELLLRHSSLKQTPEQSKRRKNLVRTRLIRPIVMSWALVLEFGKLYVRFGFGFRFRFVFVFVCVLLLFLQLERQARLVHGPGVRERLIQL
jgi:hypothetical protein